MSLLEEALAAGKSARHSPCVVGRWIGNLEDDDAQEVRDLLDADVDEIGHLLSYQIISRHWRELPFSVDALRRHRNRRRDGNAKGCSCP